MIKPTPTPIPKIAIETFMVVSNKYPAIDSTRHRTFNGFGTGGNVIVVPDGESGVCGGVKAVAVVVVTCGDGVVVVVAVAAEVVSDDDFRLLPWRLTCSCGLFCPFGCLVMSVGFKVALSSG